MSAGAGEGAYRCVQASDQLPPPSLDSILYRLLTPTLPIPFNLI